MPKNTIPEQLRVKEVARLLGHSTRWVQRKIDAGELEVFRWSANDVTVSLASVERLVNQARVGAAAPLFRI